MTLTYRNMLKFTSGGGGGGGRGEGNQQPLLCSHKREMIMNTCRFMFIEG